jgi:hypothetical protein
LAVLALVLSGCAGAGVLVTGLATAGVAGTVGGATGNAALGVAAGVAASLGVDQGVKWGERHLDGSVQTAIAAAAGPLDVGQSAPWKVEGWLPLSDRDGTVEVARQFGDAIPCKDVVYKFTGDKSGRIFATAVCRSDEGVWVWALSEPSIYRWGYLQ